MAAAEFVQRLDDPMKRDENIVHVAANWLKQDRETAERWIASATIPHDLKQQLLSQ